MPGYPWLARGSSPDAAAAGVVPDDGAYLVLDLVLPDGFGALDVKVSRLNGIEPYALLHASLIGHRVA